MPVVLVVAEQSAEFGYAVQLTFVFEVDWICCGKV